MPVPQLELIPLRSAVSSDRPTTIDVLVRIVLPSAEVEFKRPPLNLALAIDRSSSMRGQKLEFARQAACYALQHLLDTDWVSVTVFDREPYTLVSSTLAVDKAQIAHQIQQIQPGYGTALHAGWLAGSMEVLRNLKTEQLNRVILLSDGLASVGQRKPDAIAADVRAMAQQHISTTTIGVGHSYDEDLLTAMARNGDGTYYHIESPQQLPGIFQAELQGLMATLGHSVTLSIEPQGGVEVEDVLNDLDADRCGRFQLPNLIVGYSFGVVVRLKVPAIADSADLCYFRLAWVEPQQEMQQKIQATLHLPAASSGQLTEFPTNPEVQQQVVLMMAARAKKKAVRLVDRGDYEAASLLLQEAREQVLNAPDSPLMGQEAQALANLDADLKARRLRKLRKQAIYESYTTQVTSRFF